MPHQRGGFVAGRWLQAQAIEQTDTVVRLGRASRWSTASTSKLQFGQQTAVLDHAGGVSIFAIGNPTSAGQSKPFFSIRGGVNQFLFSANLSSSGSYSAGQLAMFVANGTVAVKAGAIDGNMHSFGGVWKPSVVRELYVDGVSQSASITGTVTFSSDGTEYLALGALADVNLGAYSYTDDLVVVLAWNRILDDSEMRALHINPWQVFAP